jgi:hypothetical protein
MVHVAFIGSFAGQMSFLVTDRSSRRPALRVRRQTRQPSTGSIDRGGSEGEVSMVVSFGSGEAHERGAVPRRRQVGPGPRQVRLPEALDREEPLGG